MKRTRLLASVLALSLNCVSVQPPRIGITPPASNKWEYRVESMCPGTDRSALLNFMGSDGWELVAVLPEENQCHAFVFKRRLKSD